MAVCGSCRKLIDEYHHAEWDAGKRPVCTVCRIPLERQLSWQPI